MRKLAVDLHEEEFIAVNDILSKTKLKTKAELIREMLTVYSFMIGVVETGGKVGGITKEFNTNIWQEWTTEGLDNVRNVKNGG